jgi:hypothetical protein
MSSSPGNDMQIQGIRIGKGIRPLTQSGGLSVSGGVLTLYNGRGREIDSAPINEVTAKKQKFPVSGIRLRLGDTGYNLDNTHVVGGGPGWLTVSKDLGFVPRFLQAMELAGASVQR